MNGVDHQLNGPSCGLVDEENFRFFPKCHPSISRLCALKVVGGVGGGAVCVCILYMCVSNMHSMHLVKSKALLTVKSY